MKLKDLYSLEVSPKYKSISKFHNKYLIQEILDNKELKNYEALNFAFNLSFKEWIELFKYKKNIDEIIEYKKGPENISDEIEKNMIYVEYLLTKSFKKRNLKVNIFKRIIKNKILNLLNLINYLIINYLNYFFLF